MFVLPLLVGCLASQPLPAAHLKLQNLDDAYYSSGDITRPLRVLDPLSELKFSWVPQHMERAQIQTGFQLTLRSPSGVVLDTGLVESKATYHVIPAGSLGLRPATPYTWTITWRDSTGALSQQSEPQSFELSIGDEWNASYWISGGTMLLQNFDLPTDPTNSRLYVTGAGLHRVYVNGQRLGGAIPFHGQWKVWNKHVVSYAYDITKLLVKGKNAVGVMMGSGWRDLSEFAPTVPTSCDKIERILRLVVFNNDKLALATDSNWLVTDQGHVVKSQIYDGEIIDNRKQMQGWSTPTFRPDSRWTGATVITCFNPLIEPASIPAVEFIREVKPVSIKNVAPTCPSNIVGGIVAEAGTLALRCSDGGTMKKVEFASFGLASGNCPSFSKDSSCDASTSVAIVEKACVGKTSCNLQATVDFFGTDPCKNVVKRLAVVLSGCQGEVSGPIVVDFGENLSGWLRLRAKGAAGTQFVVRHAEVLMHPPYGPADGTIYTGNLRSALAQETITLSGDAAGEEFEPHFTYHGFQYAQLQGYPGTLTKDNITMRHFRSAVKTTSTFNSASPVINMIQHHALIGQSSNLMTVPTDCPQRDERLGWMGDSDLSVMSMSLNFDMAAFTDNWLRTIADEQFSDGSLPDTVPNARYGGRPADPSWSAAYPQNVYARFKVDGDLAPVRLHWNGLLKYFVNIQDQINNAGSVSRWGAPYGDWVPADGNVKVPNNMCGAYNYIINLRQAAEMAVAIGQTADAATLTKNADRMVGLFTDAFYNSTSKCWDKCQQAGFALAYMAGAVTKDQVQAVKQTLLDDIKRRDNHVSVGIIGAATLFPTLTALGAQDVAVTLAEQTTYPSWGFMIYNNVEPATSNVWELWNGHTEGPGMNSRNHHMFSSISEWIVKSVGGVSGTCRPMDGANTDSASNAFTFTPASSLGVSWASASYMSSCGQVSSSYQRAGTTQCTKTPEGVSSQQPIGPKSEDAQLDCGVDGGSIEAVTFASWGYPEGGCGAFSKNASCHAAHSQEVVEALCLGKTKCTIPTHADFWAPKGDSFCPIADAAMRRLYVQVKCSGTHSIKSDISLPVGGRGVLTMPSYDVAPEAMTLKLDDSVIYSQGKTLLQEAHKGVLGVSVLENAVRVEVASGDYSFRLSVA